MNPDLRAAVDALARMPEQERDNFGRFMALTEFSDGCWLWRGGIGRNGYGRFWTKAGRSTAHRWIYERVVGPIPADHQLDHLCRVRNCVRPEHVEPVTALEHNRRTHAPTVRCPSGHSYDEANTRWYGGRRYCRACNNNGGEARQTTGSRPRRPGSRRPIAGPKPLLYTAADGRPIEVYPDDGDHLWRYRVKVEDGQAVGVPSRGYIRKDGALRAARREHPPASVTTVLLDHYGEAP